VPLIWRSRNPLQPLQKESGFGAGQPCELFHDRQGNDQRHDSDARLKRALCQLAQLTAVAGERDLISGRIQLNEINEGFAALKSAAPVRQLIDFGA
jgi:hypothetical protein